MRAVLRDCWASFFSERAIFYRQKKGSLDDLGMAVVVQRIFGEYLDGCGDRAIAVRLNRDGVPCPSASRPEQNRHRLADG